MTTATPTVLKLLRGNPGKRPINKNEPQPPKAIPKMPAHLDAKAKTAWKELTKLLDDMGVLTLADAKALEILCGIYARMRDLQKEIKRDGYVQQIPNVNGDLMARANPAVSLLQKDESTFKAYLSEFGLTPAARTKVSTTNKPALDDPLAKYGL